MYLLAVKTFARCVPLKEIIVVDDMSLTERDKALLRENVVGIDIRPITGMLNASCPSGGDWEGFLLIGERAASDFCVLLDADTVVTGDISEVRDCIARNVSFTLGTWKNQEIESMKEAREYVKGKQSSHVQILAERSLIELGPKFGRGTYEDAAGSRGSPAAETFERISRSFRAR